MERLRRFVFIGMLLGITVGCGGGRHLREGVRAPDFTLQSQEGAAVTLSEYTRKGFVVLYFYPKDDTPGCRKQACFFRDLHADKLVESATLIYCGYLLLAPAQRSAHKHALAEHFMNEELRRVRLRRDQVLSGTRTFLDRMPELLQYE